MCFLLLLPSVSCDSTGDDKAFLEGDEVGDEDEVDEECVDCIMAVSFSINVVVSRFLRCEIRFCCGTARSAAALVSGKEIFLGTYNFNFYLRVQHVT